ncbi:hypothetical protein HH214_19920 [Mucilaginibacter robiniae]|uniref:Uncharacterized protein n=1 Tax=Mucilaginibacter robiniae TaxID=2728022 RepID=A0A7L5E3Q8_9SPHI|nr:hypothetical protein [Mucilaginibacter robiniae]QJD97982.1 hypothetical protein HH214_19920 [Mucilaginibacter robiniae]
MQPKAFFSFLGFTLLLVATYCPLLRPFGLINWDLYDLNKPYGIVVLLVAVVGIASILLKQYSVKRIAGWMALALVILVYIAAVLKVKSSFSFIPFKGMAGVLTRQIHFKWGWFLLFAGALLSIIPLSKNSIP